MEGAEAVKEGVGVAAPAGAFEVGFQGGEDGGVGGVSGGVPGGAVLGFCREGGVGGGDLRGV